MSNPTHICSNCRGVGNPTTTTPGSFLIELVLWCLFLLPGLIYSVWRISERKSNVCRMCGAPMYSLSTHQGQWFYRRCMEGHRLTQGGS